MKTGVYAHRQLKQKIFYMKMPLFTIILYFCTALARMAELVDALVSGTSDRKVVQVRVLFRAQKNEMYIV